MKRALRSWFCLVCLTGCVEDAGPAGPHAWGSDTDGVSDGEPLPNEDSDSETDEGAGDGDAAPHLPDAGGDAGTTRPATFQNVYAILAAHCLECHGEGEIFGELSFKSRSTAYKQLVGALAQGTLCFDGARRRVVAGEPDASLLLRKLEHTQDCGLPMPTHGGPLPEPDLALIREWITLGAVR